MRLGSVCFCCCSRVEGLGRQPRAGSVSAPQAPAELGSEAVWTPRILQGPGGLSQPEVWAWAAESRPMAARAELPRPVPMHTRSGGPPTCKAPQPHVCARGSPALPGPVRTPGWALASHLLEGPGRQGCARERPSGEGTPRENCGPELLWWVGAGTLCGPSGRLDSVRPPAGTSRRVWGSGWTPERPGLGDCSQAVRGAGCYNVSSPCTAAPRGLREGSRWVWGHFFATVRSHESLLCGAQPTAEPDLRGAGPAAPHKGQLCTGAD